MDMIITYKIIHGLVCVPCGEWRMDMIITYKIIHGLVCVPCGEFFVHYLFLQSRQTLLIAFIINYVLYIVIISNCSLFMHYCACTLVIYILGKPAVLPA